MMRSLMRGVSVPYSRWSFALRRRRQVERNAALSAQLVQFQQEMSLMLQALQELRESNRSTTGEAYNPRSGLRIDTPDDANGLALHCDAHGLRVNFPDGGHRSDQTATAPAMGIGEQQSAEPFTAFLDRTDLPGMMP